MRKIRYICSKYNLFVKNMSTVSYVIMLLYVLMMAATAVAIIVDKRDPVKSLSWIVVLVTLPVVGFLLYLIFGQNLRRRRKLTLKEAAMRSRRGKVASKQMVEVNNLHFDIFPSIQRNLNIVKLLINNNLAPITIDNDLEILKDASDTLSSLLKELTKAEQFIHMEYYIIEKGEMWSAIVSVLKERAAKGVEVKIIFDYVGSWGMKKRDVHELRSYGIEVEMFMPVIFPRLARRINYRNHRKIVVIDGKVGFTGGINIADRYIKGLPEIGLWRDTHLKITGGALMSLETIFVADWAFCCGEKLELLNYVETAEYQGTCGVQIASSGPDSDWASIMQAFFLAITTAKEHIYISTPYFIPNTAILTALKVAAMSGVEVCLLIPKKADSKLTYWATRSYIAELLDAGVKVYQYLLGFNHSKIIMIDSVFSSIGTVNMDVRSFEDNFEVAAMIYDREKTTELEAQFLDDIRGSELISRSEWAKNPRITNLYEGLARLMSPLL